MRTEMTGLVAAAAIALVAMSTPEAKAFVVQTINGTDLQADWGGRWRCMQPSCTGKELMLGKSPGTAGQFVDTDVSPRAPGTYAFELLWNTSTNEASVKWGSTVLAADLDTWSVSKTGDDLSIFINNATNNSTSMSLAGVQVSLDGGTYSTVGTGAFAPATGTQATYGILNLGSFTTLALMGTFTFDGGSSQERPSFTISSGNYTGTVVPIPAALPIALAAFGGFGLAGWRRRRPTA